MLAVMIVVKITNSVAKTNKSKNIQYRLQFGLSSLNLVVLKHGSFKMFEAIWNVNAIALCVLWVLRILRQQFAVHQKRVKRSAFEMQRQSINGTFHVQYTDRYSMEPGKYWKRAKREWQEIQSLSVQYRLTQCWPFPMPTNCSKRKKYTAWKYWNYDCINHTLFILNETCIVHLAPTSNYLNNKCESRPGSQTSQSQSMKLCASYNI